jgi:iron complex outermembrane receptor protein
MRVREAGLVVATVAALLGLSEPGMAQQGVVTGRVVDAETAQPLPSVQVQAVGASGGGGLTNDQGTFRLSLPAGSYSLAIVSLGYQDARLDGIEVAAGETVNLGDVLLTPTALMLDPLVVTSRRGQTERASAAPAAVGVVPTERIVERAVTTPVDHVKAMPGVDVIQTGLTQSNTVTRGFNNVFSGSLLVLTDNRYARVPSLRLNAFNMIPATPLDVERVEVVLGPAAALYGPNSASGVMHLITSSPIDRPGTTLSLMAGNRDIFQGMFRQAWRFNETSGLKISGQYFRGNDFESTDPVEVAMAAADPSNPLIAARDFTSERFGGELRYDLRPWDEPEDGLVITYGFNQLATSIELTGIGAGQARDWRYQFGQVQLDIGGLFAQAFLNASDAGDTYLLRTGQPIVDESTMVAAQAQYELAPIERLDLIGGVDFSRTTPKTGGTITGSNEDSDETTEVGGYVHGTLALTDQLDLVGALRLDYHQHLEDPVWSPRAGLVYEPVAGHSFRATYNRAFSTPTTNNLFLDIIAGRIPIVEGISYGVRTFGVPESGLTWNEQCAGGVSGYCMYSPFAPATQLPANGAALWDGVVVPAALQDPELQAALTAIGMTPTQFAAAVGSPAPGDLSSILLRFNSENPLVPFLPDPGITPVGRIRPTITTTYELGYQGLIAERLKLSGSVYRSDIKDFVGPLRVETPSVFLTEASVASYLEGRLTAAGVPAPVAAQMAAGVAETASSVPLGTVAPDQREDSDLVLTYRNFGDVDLWGFDLGFEAYATDQLAFTGSYSHVSEECFDFDADGDCTGTADISLNAPAHKASLGARYSTASSGITVGGRMRYSAEFPMNSGVFVGAVDSYTVFDANVAYRVPGYQGFIVSLTLNNVLDNEHREFVGAPELGIVGLVKVQYEFGGG